MKYLKSLLGMLLIVSCESDPSDQIIDFSSVHVSSEYNDSIIQLLTSDLQKDTLFTQWKFNQPIIDTIPSAGSFYFESYKIEADRLVNYQINLKIRRYQNPLLSTILRPQDICQFKTNPEGTNFEIFDTIQKHFIPLNSVRGKVIFRESLINE